MATADELRRAMVEERERHDDTLRGLSRELDQLRSALEDQREAFQQLLMRVVSLRVAKAESGAAKAAGSLVEERFDTGCAMVDRFLYDVQDRLRAADLLGDSVLGKLHRAARGLVTEGFPVDRTPGARATSIAIATRNEVRGTRQWMVRHCQQCVPCGLRAQSLRPFERTDERSCGLAAVPDVSRIPGKRTAKVGVRLFRAHPLALHDATTTMELLRVTVALGATVTKGDRTLADAAQCAVAAAERWVQRALEAARRAVQEASLQETNVFLTAMEVLLHAVKPLVSVKPSEDGLRVDVKLSLPPYAVQVEAMKEAFADAAQREYIIKKFILPIAQRIGECLGASAVATEGVAIAARAIDALMRLSLHKQKAPASPKTKSSGKRTEKSSQKSSPNTMEQLTEVVDSVHAVLLALAVFGTSVEFDAAVPRLGEEAIAKGGTVVFKRAALRVAQSFLRLLTPPQCSVPPVNDSAAADVVLRLRNAPTAFLDVLNNVFSSSKRLPSTSRVSVVDFLASPKSQIRYALKLFSEVAVDLCRPFAPDSGFVIADENGKSGRPKAPSCTPRADLPPGIVRANTRVAARAEELLRRVGEWMNAAAVESEVECRGREILKRVVEDFTEEDARKALREDLEAIHVKVTEFKEAQVYLLLPFGLNVSGTSQDLSEVLYLRLHVQQSTPSA